jgi:hypothetical protein
MDLEGANREAIGRRRARCLDAARPAMTKRT